MDLFIKKQAGPPHCAAVVVAAGSSQRMGSDKLGTLVGGVPVLVRTLKAFQDSPLVDEIVLVTRMDKLESDAELCQQYGLSKVSRVICGGSTRSESALAGVSELGSKAGLIAIHDGARPFVSQALIERTVLAAGVSKAAAPVIRSADTLKAVDEHGLITATVDREQVLRVQTPQVFQAELIKGALTYAVEKKLPYTDECAAIEATGFRTQTVDGDEENIKITVPFDLLLAEAILRRREEQA